MKYDWTKYKDKILKLKEIFSSRNEGTDVEVDVITPEDPDFDPKMEMPYVRVRYYVDDHYHERKIELFEHYLKQDLQELVNQIEFFIQEFEGEIESSEYGGG
ncbi:MAG: dephospho-CoA kinase [Aquificae bacterium]|nr:dephospho-CoA kinase [Aquificota bacterium]